MRPSVERDTPRPPFAEPFAAMFWRVRVQTYLLVFAFAVVSVEGCITLRLATEARAHVYEVHPDGKALYLGDREANLAPRPAEGRYVAREFVQLVYGWNSSTVHQDVAEAVRMCAPAMAEQFRVELADAQYLETIRRRQIRSELTFDRLEVTEEARRSFAVALSGRVDIYPLTVYEGAPIESRRFSLRVYLAAVPREPDLRPNGLEVVRLERDAPPLERPR